MSETVDYDDVPDTRDIKPPHAHELPMRVLAVERAARARRSISDQNHKAATTRDEVLTARLDKIEKLGARLGMGIAAASVSVMVTVVSAASYVGSRFERIESTASVVQQHDRRIERLEGKAMGHTVND